MQESRRRPKTISQKKALLAIERGRERRHQKTLEQITKAGIRLFVCHGFEGTTLEQIAKGARISRRTFFNYFKSKEDVLLAAHDAGVVEALRLLMLEESTEQKPIEAARRCLLRLVPCYETEEAVTIDRLLSSTGALRDRKHAIYAEMEQRLFAALRELWPKPERRGKLRTVAMVSLGVLRLSLESWREEDCKHSLNEYLLKNFANLKAEI